MVFLQSIFGYRSGVLLSPFYASLLGHKQPYEVGTMMGSIFRGYRQQSQAQRYEITCLRWGWEDLELKGWLISGLFPIVWTLKVAKQIKKKVTPPYKCYIQLVTQAAEVF